MHNQAYGQPVAPYGPPMQFYPQPPQVHWTCQHCGFVGAPNRLQEISPLAWVFFVFLVFACLVLCWVPLVAIKRPVEVCPQCGHKHIQK